MFKFLKFFNKGPASTPEISITAKEYEKVKKLFINHLKKSSYEGTSLNLIPSADKSLNKKNIIKAHKIVTKRIYLKNLFSISFLWSMFWKGLILLFFIFCIICVWNIIGYFPFAQNTVIKTITSITKSGFTGLWTAIKYVALHIYSLFK